MTLPPSYPEAEAVRELVTAGLRHAEGLTAQLAKLDWRPGRAHIEQARNSIQKLAELLDQQSDEVGAYALALEQALHHAPAQGSRVPKVRTSHHRNKEESARLQGLVAKRYAAPHPMLEAMGEIANRAGNFMDKDAADWMPSIYKIACEAIGADPWPMLEANGWKRETLTVSLSSTGREFPTDPNDPKYNMVGMGDAHTTPNCGGK